MTDYIHISVDFDWIPGSDLHVMRLYEMFAKYEVKATLFFTGAFASAHPQLLCEAYGLGHEIGCHGLKHGLDTEENFAAKVAYTTQKELIQTSTDILNQITGSSIQCFRAPYLKICDTTFKVLAELAYKIDSSLPSMRFDFGCGSICSLQHFAKSCHPHFICVEHTKLLEIPPSAWIIPLNMRMLRSFPFVISRSFLRLLTAIHNPLVFYMHPAEITNKADLRIPDNNTPGFYRNCGVQHFRTLELMLKYLRDKGIRSETMAYTYRKEGDLDYNYD